MALWLCLSKFDGILNGVEYRHRPGDVVDDAQEPVAALRLVGLDCYSYVPSAGLTAAIAAYNEAHGADADPPGLLETLVAAGLNAGSFSFAAPVNVSTTANAEGAATTLSRSDHKHDVTTAVPGGAVAPGAVAAEGAGAAVANANHVHTCPATWAPDPHHAAHEPGGADEIARLVSLIGRLGAGNWPEIDGFDGGAILAAGGDVVIVGRHLLQGQTFAHLVLGASLDIIACRPGDAGNLIEVEVIDSGLGGLTLAFAGGVLTIDQGGSGSNENTVAMAVNNAASPAYQVLRANSGGGGAVPVTAQAPLAGGAGDGWECIVGGVDAPVLHDVGAAVSNANLAEGGATVTVPALAPWVATDIVTTAIRTDGIMSQPISCELA